MSANVALAVMLGAVVLTSTAAHATDEVWVAYISDYHTTTDLADCQTNGFGIRDELNREGDWVHTLTGNDGTRWSHWKKTSDNSYADTADFGYFCGHGGMLENSTTNRNGFVSIENNFEDVLHHSWHSKYSEAGMDLEWVTWDTSRTLDWDDSNSNQNIKEWFNLPFQGLHLMIGWHDSPDDTTSGREFFDSMIDTGSFDGGGNKIKTAWHDPLGGCIGNDLLNTRQTVMGEHSTHGDDYLPGEGSGPQPDQPHDSTVVLWKNTC